MNIFLNYLAALIPLVIIDALWIGVIAKGFYAKYLGFLFSKTPNIIPVFVFYPLYAFAILYLVVMPAVSSKSWTEALIRGMVLGLAAYGAYDLSNHATIAHWPVVVTITDIAWGTFVTSVVSVIAYFLITR